MRHLNTVADLDRRQILEILDRSDSHRHSRRRAKPSLTGHVAGLFFFQSSTRTRLGFHAAAARLGATTLPLGSMRQDPGMSQAESALDAFRSVAAYCDVIVLRHLDENEHQQMVAKAPVPVINAGCGTRHHPTQALVDLFYVRSRFGRLDGLRWGIAGDLANSRAARSLIDALLYFKPSELRLMSPAARALPLDDLGQFQRLPIRRLEQFEVSGLDILYMAGFPEGSGSSRADAEERHRFRLDFAKVGELPHASVILDPLPRIDEIERAIDNLPQAAYFDQSRYGLFVRMAVLEHLLFHEQEDASGREVVPPTS
jgi:aspartate carbamoyltransferase catalytic subunit